ncbi:hypothetical protein [Zunongwangia endophytica]|uniref:Trimeric autotransporter adhesin YadA-like head domain-containing protein n=1 Tax=Zunongwangia endophytica TaxID=1808945 RepID=A0ABV8H8Q8_9FLAO|nr:hypothetical protein [Zunongwangia endophytica]MDN3595163.1 hypothetical protein [Zunongwangia endophytica]
MKTNNIIFFICLLMSGMASSQIGINTTKPDPSSIVDIRSKHAGVLIPRVELNSLVDRVTVPNPVLGLLVYNDIKLKDLEERFYFWDGEKWDKIQSQNDFDYLENRIDSLNSGSGAGSFAWGLEGNDLGYSGTSDRFIGSTTYSELNFKVNNEQIGNFHPNGGVSLGIGAITDNSQRSFALGQESDASGNQDAFAIGTKAKANTNRSVALGYNAETNQTNAFALGVNSKADGTSSFAVGSNSKASATDAFAIGTGADASSSASLAIGQNSRSSNVNSLAIGVSANASNQFSIALGNGATSSGMHAMSIGGSSTATADKSIAYGFKSVADGVNSIALGYEAKTKGLNAVAIGYGAKADQDNTVIIGNAGYDSNGGKNDWYKSKVGIGTYKPEASLDLHGSFKLVDGTEGAGKVLTSDGNGNASWKDASSAGGSSTNNNDEVFGDIYNDGAQSLRKDRSAFSINFNKSSYLKNSQMSSNGIMVEKSGVYEANATISLQIDNNVTENTIYEFYFAKWSNKVDGSSVFITIDSSVKGGEIFTISLNKLVELNQWEQLAVYARKYNNRGEGDKLSLVSGSSNFNLKRVGTL